MAERTRRGPATALLVPGLVTAALAAPAQAAENTPPTPRDDTVTVYAGGTRHLAVLTNDTDADGDDLAVCRIGETSRGLTVRQPRPAPPGAPPELAEPGDLVVTAGRKTAGRELSVVYYACDDERLAPATVTLEVLEPTPMSVRALPRRPRTFVVRNTQDFVVDFTVGYREGSTYSVSGTTLGAGKRQRFTIPAAARNASWGASSDRRGYLDRGRLCRP